MIYLANAFSPNMLQFPADVSFKSITADELCEAIHGKIINAIGHQGTISLVNLLCNTNLQVNRTVIKANVGDVVYIVMLGFRLEEGKIMTSEEVLEAYHKGKIMLIKAEVYGSVLRDLAACEGVCNEYEYDALAYRVKRGQ